MSYDFYGSMTCFHRLLPALMLVSLIGCDSAITEPEGPGVVNGVDLDALFAPASAMEVAAIKAEWANRDVSARGIQEMQAETVEIARMTADVRIVAHQVTGQTHFGAIIVPAAASPTQKLPVLMYLHGGDAGISVDGEVNFVLQLFGPLRHEFVVVIPSFRDEPVSFAGQEWKSDGPPSPWNYDVDDAIALLNVALETTPQADADRVAAFGMSRGAAVAMLMAARDARIDQVLEFFGPTDFFGPFVQEVTIEALEGNPRNLPGLDFMNRTFLEPLARGELTPEQLRPEIVRRSAVLFVDDLPPLQMHHGEQDDVVPVSQARLLIKAMSAAGKQPPEFQGFLYQTGEHNPISLPGAFDRSIEALRLLFD